MSLETVPVRIPTEREGAAEAVVSNGGVPMIPAEAKMLPRPPLHCVTTAGGASHLGVPADAAEDINVGDLIAAPAPVGQPWAVYEVLAHVGLWAETFPLPDGMDDEYAGWALLAATPARDKMTTSRWAAETFRRNLEMNHAHERDRAERYMLRRAAECAEIAEKLKRADPEQIARMVDRLYDDDGRDALLAALNRAEQEAVEQVPAAA